MAVQKLPLSFYSFDCLGGRMLCWQLYLDTCGAHIMLGTVMLLYLCSFCQPPYTCTLTNLYLGASLTSVEVWRVEFSFSKSGNEQIHKQTNTRIHTWAFQFRWKCPNQSFLPRVLLRISFLVFLNFKYRQRNGEISQCQYLDLCVI